MAHEHVEEFIRLLGEVEAGGDTKALASLFTDGCEVGNLTLTQPLHGIGGAGEFWTHYQKTLGDVRSVFKNKIVDGDRAALEWETEGSDGKIHYRGVSILEYEGDKIVRFFAYFDPAKLGAQLAERHHG